MKKFTISDVKQAFRDKNSIYIEHAKDNAELLKYLYRLERREIIYPKVENKEFNVSIYGLNYNRIDFNVNINCPELLY